MTNRRAEITPLVLASVLLLCLPVGQSQPVAPGASFQASKLAWESPGGQTVGDFVGFLGRAVDANALLPSATPAADLSNSFFELKAEQLDVVVDIADVFLAAIAASSAVPPATPYSPSPTVHSEQSTYKSAVMTGTTAREGQFLYAFPAPGERLQVSADCANAAASPVSGIHAPGVILAEHAIDADTSAAMEIAPCEDQPIVLKGDFRVVIWERDGTMASTDGVSSFWSGKHQADSPVDARPFAGKAQEMFITVHNGELRLVASSDLAPLLYMNSVSVQGASSITMSDALGHMGIDQREVRGQTVRLGGSIAATYARGGDALRVNVSSGIQDVTADGRPVAMATAVAPPVGNGSSRLWGWSLGGVGAVGAVLVARVAGVRRRHVADLAHVDELGEVVDHLLAAQEPARAIPAARRLLELAPTDPLSHLRAARAFRRGGHIGEAVRVNNLLAVLRQTQGIDARLGAEMDLEAAVANYDHSFASPADQRGTLQRVALRSLQSAVAQNPAVLDDLEAYPGLEALWWDSRN